MSTEPKEKSANTAKSNEIGPPSDTETQLVFDTNFGTNVKTNLRDVLVREPVALEVNEFDEASAKAFEAGVARALRTGQPILPITIDSYGGYVYSLFRMLDAIRVAKDRGLTVVTIAKSKAMSCGGVLFAAGDKRYVGEDAIVMVHDVWDFNMGKLPDLQADTKHTTYLGKRLFDLLDAACRQDPGYWADRVHTAGHANVYLTADEAMQCGIATKIGTPAFGITVVANYYLDDVTVRVAT